MGQLVAVMESSLEKRNFEMRLEGYIGVPSPTGEGGGEGESSRQEKWHK